MFQMPTSSPMMTTMFGFFAAGAGAVAVAVAVETALARASSESLPIPFEQQEGSSAPWQIGPASFSTGEVVDGVTLARDEGRKSLLAATRPIMRPSPTQAGAFIVPIFMS